MRLLILALAIAAAGCNADPAPAAGPSVHASPDTTPAPSDGADDAASPPVDQSSRAAPVEDLPAADSTSVPARFQGRYAADAAACSSIDHESELSIGPNSIQFHESRGPVTSVARNQDGLTVVVELTGEGETRDATYRFKLSGDGNTLTDSDGGMARQRCG